jgi:hypothetical protein
MKNNDCGPSQMLKAKKKLKNQVSSAFSSRTVVPHFALTVRPFPSDCACNCRASRTDRAHYTHDRASLQWPVLAVFTLGTVVCLLGTTMRPSQAVLAVTNSWNFAIKAL